MNTKINERRARALTFMLSLGMLAGVLIWAKLRLVTDMPRSALAEPDHANGPLLPAVDPESNPDDPILDDGLDADSTLQQQSIHSTEGSDSHTDDSED